LGIPGHEIKGKFRPRIKYSILFYDLSATITAFKSWIPRRAFLRFKYRSTPGAPSAKHLLEHLERLKALEALDLPEAMQRRIHQNRWLKLAREGGQMTAQHLRDLETTRRYATLVAVLLETKATVIDQTLDLHDRMIGALFNRAKHRHAEEFQQSGKAIHDKVRLYWRIGEALLEAKQSGVDPFGAIEAIIPWEAFVQSVTEAQRLAGAEDFDYLHRISDGYTQIRRYAPAFLNAFRFKAAPAAQAILEAVETLRAMNADNLRKVPADAPTGFVRKRWETLVFSDAGIDRRFYELCALAELKNALRSGDIWVQGSRQFKDFDEYLIPSERFNALLEAKRLPLVVGTDCEAYLQGQSRYPGTSTVSVIIASRLPSTEPVFSVSALEESTRRNIQEASGG
jgi:hypothetical protein